MPLGRPERESGMRNLERRLMTVAGIVFSLLAIAVSVAGFPIFGLPCMVLSAVHFILADQA